MTSLSFAFRTLFTFAFLCTCFIPVTVFAETDKPSDIDELRMALIQLQKSLDHSNFNLSALAEETKNKTAIEIADTVKSRVATQIYSGILRGAEGTLSSASGNAWDQALLLSELLKTAGYQTRFVQTALPSNEAEQLLAASAIPTARPASRDPDSSLAALQGIKNISGGQVDEAVIQLLHGHLPAPVPIEVVTKAATVLEASLGSSMPDGEALKKKLHDESVNYVWVQARRSSEESWEDYHTAFTPNSTIEADHVLGGTLPAEAYHRYSVQISVEVSENGKLSQTPLFEEVDISLAKSVQNAVPIALITGDALRGVENPKVNDDSYFVPLIFGELADGTQAFNNKGDLVDARLFLKNGIGTTGQSTSSALGGLGGLFGGLNGKIGGTADSAVKSDQTQAVGFVLTLSYRAAFSKKPMVFSRLLIDRIGQDRRASGDFQLSKDAARFAGKWTILSNGGQVGMAQLFDTQIGQLQALIQPEYGISNDRFSATATAALFDDIASSPGGEDTLMYRSNPFIAVLAIEGATDTTGRVGFDIVNSGLRALVKNAHSWIPDTSTALRAGVAETMLEGALVESVASMFNTLKFSSAWHSLEPKESFAVISRHAALGDNIDNMIIAGIAQAELNRGQLIALTGKPEVAWWRVDSVSGVATGVDRFGRGGSFIEKVITIENALYVADALSTFYFLQDDFMTCLEKPSWTNAAKMHALPVEAAAMAGMTWALQEKVKNSLYGGKAALRNIFAVHLIAVSVGLELIGVGIDC
jgi:hypothetical protein